jgi:hypothetical protein
MRLQRTQINDIFRLVFLCRFTSLGGPLLVLGEAAPTVMQYGMAGFALPTTPPRPLSPFPPPQVSRATLAYQISSFGDAVPDDFSDNFQRRGDFVAPAFNLEGRGLLQRAA